jgi:hypothetical protein
MTRFCLVVVCVSSAIIGFFIGHQIGRTDLMTHTVVRHGTPYYSGVFFGQCFGQFEYCAADSRQKYDGSPKESWESPK